jgi:hypothetical protein
VEENVMGTQRLVESPVESVEASGSVAQGFRGRRVAPVSGSNNEIDPSSFRTNTVFASAPLRVADHAMATVAIRTAAAAAMPIAMSAMRSRLRISLRC